MESHDAPSQSTHPTPKVPLAGTKHKSSLSKISLPSLDAMTRDQVSRYALTASIDGGGFEDVKFFAFSRRNSKGRAFAPMSLFGNSTCIRKTAPHFDVVLTQGFAESIIADLNMAYPRDRPAALDSYDYPDDSDMDDVDDEDIALEGEGGDRAPSHEDDCSGASESVRLLSDETCRDTGSGRPGRVIFIEDMAFQTTISRS
ncbi:hypothetical protein C8Q76DRAFT_31138 [Earliella scabrosa]|nr:hypothetical protein C8Q76DRAFT_31138 [Earliella scabrosa]